MIEETIFVLINSYNANKPKNFKQISDLFNILGIVDDIGTSGTKTPNYQKHLSKITRTTKNTYRTNHLNKRNIEFMSLSMYLYVSLYGVYLCAPVLRTLVIPLKMGFQTLNAKATKLNTEMTSSYHLTTWRKSNLI